MVAITFLSIYESLLIFVLFLKTSEVSLEYAVNYVRKDCAILLQMASFITVTLFPVTLYFNRKK